MGFKFQKRINLGGGLGFNISKSGISPSLRTQLGSISNKKISAKTGIPGVSYDNTFKSNKSGCTGIFLIGVITFLIYIIKHY